MQCKNHPDRPATHFCEECRIPLCDDCAEEIEPGRYYCFKCAMMSSVSAVGTTMQDKRERVAEEKGKAKKKLTAFHYFIIVSSALILAMWGFILFGGQAPPEFEGRMDIGSNTRVLLFMVDSGIKSYAHAEGNTYPEKLPDLIPKYLLLEAGQVPLLEVLSYKKNTETGYQLSLAHPKPGEMQIIISADGIQYQLPSGEEA
jgi:hypothetical protein